MDPHATWRDLQDEVIAENWDSAKELAQALLDWLHADGFPPVIGSADLPYGWHRQLAEAGARFALAAADPEFQNQDSQS